MSLSLRNRMIVYISIPVIFVLLVLTVFTYYQSSVALDQQIRRSASFVVENYSNEIQKRLAEKEAIVSVLAKEYGVHIPAEADLRKSLTAIMRETPGIQTVFIGFADKRFLDA